MKEQGVVCQRVGELCSEPLSTQTFQLMDAELDKLAKLQIEPTQNVAVQFCYLKVQVLLAHENYDAAVNVLMFTPRKGATLSGDRNLDRTAPQLVRYFPTVDEELGLEEDEPEMPSEERACIDWRKDRRFDEEVKSFGDNYFKGFASDALFDLVQSNMQGSLTFFRLLVMARSEYDSDIGHEGYNPGPLAFKACHKCIDFAEAYIAIVGDMPLTLHTHGLVTNIFSRQTAAYAMFKLLVAAARRLDKFVQLEMDAVKVASKELQHQVRFYAFKNAIDEDRLDDSIIGDVMSVWEGMMQMRSSAWRSLVSPLHMYFAKRIKELLELNPATPSSFETLKLIRGYVDEVPQPSEEEAATITDMKSKADKTLQDLTSSLATATIQEHLDSKDEHAALWFGTTEFRNLIDDAGDFASLDLDKVFQNLALAAMSRVNSLGNAATDEVIGETSMISKNILAVNSEASKRGVCTKFPAAQVSHAINKALRVFEAGVAYKSAQTKGNFNGLNKAYLEWDTVKVPRETPECETLTRTMLQANLEYRHAWTSEVNKRLKESAMEYQAVLQEHEKISGGGRNCESWKDADLVKGVTTLEDLVSKCHTPKTGLLAGAGLKVQSAHELIMQAHLFYLLFNVVWTLLGALRSKASFRSWRCSCGLVSGVGPTRPVYLHRVRVCVVCVCGGMGPLFA